MNTALKTQSATPLEEDKAMVGILILTHETLGQAYSKLCEHFFGTQVNHLTILGVQKSDTPEAIAIRIQDIIENLNNGAGVLILTDIYGATPCNVAKNLVNTEDIIIITGLNAPMFIKAMQGSQQLENLEQLAEQVKLAAQAGVMEINIENLKQYT